LGRRSRAAGILGAVFVDETGETVALGDWLAGKLRDAQAREAASEKPAEQPALDGAS
jgi:hypothetical protein